MTECNIFCYSENYNEDSSFQQKRYRAFNKIVSKERFVQILKEVMQILTYSNMKLEEFWNQVTNYQWFKLLSIPEAEDFKQGFEYISGVKINLDLIEVIANGKKVLISKDSAKNLGLIR